MRQSGKRPDQSDFFSAWVAYADALEFERNTLREVLQRLVADLETNSEPGAPGAPDYAHEALERIIQ